MRKKRRWLDGLEARCWLGRWIGEWITTFTAEFLSRFVQSLAVWTWYVKGDPTLGTELPPLAVRMTATWAYHIAPP